MIIMTVANIIVIRISKNSNCIVVVVVVAVVIIIVMMMMMMIKNKNKKNILFNRRLLSHLALAGGAFSQETSRRSRSIKGATLALAPRCHGGF